jgi:nicotinamide-nucleotide amidase
MRAYILSIGTELLHGLITDTNATFLAQELVALGIELVHVTQTGDDRTRLVTALRRALDEAELVICTGGIGPTEDDLTREAISEVVHETPAVDPDLLATLHAHFGARGQTMTERNAKQAWLIPSAEALPNLEGTAPGWYVRHGDRRIVAMPGVPREMYRMWSEQAIPRIMAERTRRVIRGTTFKTIGIGESAVEQLIEDLVAKENPVVATYAKDDGVHVRITGFGDTAEEAEAVRAEAIREVRSRLSEYIYAEGDIPLADVIINQLVERHLDLGIVESGSGGRLGHMLVSSPIAFRAIAGAYALPAILGDEPAELPSAGTLAERAVNEFSARLGLGLTVDLHPAPNLSGVYLGTISVSLRGALERDESQQNRASLADFHRRAAMAAADLLRRALRSS